MADIDGRLPATGPLPQPESVEQAREVLKAEAFPAPDVQVVTMEATEFTSLCPRTGQPDFGEVSIEYVANEPGTGIGSGTPISDFFVSQDNSTIILHRRLFGSGVKN